MIISHQHRYVFIQFPHSGSTAIGNELCEMYCGEEVLSKHSTYREFLQQATADERSYFAFSNIRNPLEVAVTKYSRYLNNRNERYTSPRMRAKHRGPLAWVDQRRFAYIHRPDVDFSDFFLRTYRLPYTSWARLDHHDLDFVIRYERIADDFATVISKLGLQLVRPLPVRNQTSGKRSDISEYYSEEARARALAVFGPYMREWGYNFPAEWGEPRVGVWDELVYEAWTRVMQLYWLKMRPGLLGARRPPPRGASGPAAMPRRRTDGSPISADPRLAEFEKPARKLRPLPARARRKLSRASKRLWQSVGFSRGPHRVVFILGCQRSGTDLMSEILDRDPRVRMFPEVSSLSSPADPRRLRLRPLDEVERIVARTPAPMVVLKPLVESQNASMLLDRFQGSRVIWMYRSFLPVAASHLDTWGGVNSIRDLAAIVDGLEGNWRTEGVSEDLRRLVAKHFDVEMNGADAAALYWYVRNSHLFSKGLDRHPAVLLCSYRELVERPEAETRRIYEFLGLPYPGERIVSIVSREPLERPINVELSPAIELLCKEMQARLDEVWARHTREELRRV